MNFATVAKYGVRDGGMRGEIPWEKSGHRRVRGSVDARDIRATKKPQTLSGLRLSCVLSLLFGSRVLERAGNVFPLEFESGKSFHDCDCNLVNVQLGSLCGCQCVAN